MTLIVEDGSGKPDSNTYADAAFVIEYAANRGITIPTEDAEVAILNAMDYIESFTERFKGQQKTFEQALSWPRVNVVINRFAFPSDAIPKQLKLALAAATVEVFNGADLMPNQDQWAVKREKIDVIEVEYAAGGSGQGGSATAPIIPTFPTIDAHLRPLLRDGGAMRLWAFRA